MPKSMPQIDELICASLRGERPVWPERAGDELVTGFLRQSSYHGVQALLHQSFQSGKGYEQGWPKTILDACRDTAIAQAMWEMRHRDLLRRVLALLSKTGVRPLLFKGTALAYDVYSSPFLRTRGDTDLIIPYEACYEVGEALESLGFTSWLGVKGTLVSYTQVFQKTDLDTGHHELDLHWRISNSQVLSKLFSYRELLSESLSLPDLSEVAIAAGGVHALLLACVHPAGHRQCPYFVGNATYYGGDRLIWLYDVHLLLGKLAPFEHDAFLELAERKGVGKVCLEAIEQAHACFHTRVPETVLAGLGRLGPAEPISRYLNGSVMYQYYANLMAVEGMATRFRFIGELFFPSKKYMLHVYREVRPNWLLWLYLRRAALEISKRFYRTTKTVGASVRIKIGARGIDYLEKFARALGF